jgi:hypothetical protein
MRGEKERRKNGREMIDRGIIFKLFLIGVLMLFSSILLSLILFDGLLAIFAWLPISFAGFELVDRYRKVF